jgi:hypothetical protein
MRPSILLTEPYGNHSNRLFQHAQFLAFSLEKNWNFQNLCAGDLANVFSGMRHSTLHGLLRRTLVAMPRRLFPFVDVTTPDELNSAVLQSPLTSITVGGWNFRASQEMMRKSFELIKETFKRREVKLGGESLRAEICRRRKSGHSIVGCHIRRGDYVTWRDGRYSFTNQQYSDAVQLAATHHGSSFKSACIVVCTNDPELASTTNDVLISNNSWWTDHEILGLCDFIVGPPSTFSSWSSYLYQKPIYAIDRINGETALFFLQINPGNPDHAFNFRLAPVSPLLNRTYSLFR